MVYGDHQVKNNHPSPSWASNIILNRWSIAKNYCALLCCCRLFVVLSCGSVSFEYKQVVKTLLIFHRQGTEGLCWWWGEENEFLQHFYASILQKRAIYIQNCPPMCHKRCLCPGSVQSAGNPISFLQIAHILASSSYNQTLLIFCTVYSTSLAFIHIYICIWVWSQQVVLNFLQSNHSLLFTTDRYIFTY